MEPQQANAEQSVETWRAFHAEHLERQTAEMVKQTNRLSHIRAYVAIWFWLTVLGVLLVVISAAENSNL